MPSKAMNSASRSTLTSNEAKTASTSAQMRNEGTESHFFMTPRRSNVSKCRHFSNLNSSGKKHRGKSTPSSAKKGKTAKMIDVSINCDMPMPFIDHQETDDGETLIEMPHTEEVAVKK